MPLLKLTANHRPAARLFRCGVSALLLIILGAVVVYYSVFVSSHFGDNLYNLALILRSASPISQHFLERSAVGLYFEPRAIPGPEDWHRNLAIIFLRCWAGLTQAGDGPLLRLPHLFWVFLWLFLSWRLLNRLEEEHPPSRVYPRRVAWAHTLGGFALLYLLILSPWGLTLLSNAYVDDIPSGVFALVALCLLMRSPLNLRRAALGAIFLSLGFAAKEFLILWAPIGLCTLFLYAFTTARRSSTCRQTSLKHLFVLGVLYIFLYIVVCIPKLIWNYHDLGEPLPSLARYFLKTMHFGGPEKWHFYPFCFLNDTSYTSAIALRGGLVPVVERIFVKTLPETARGFFILSFAWCWFAFYLLTLRRQCRVYCGQHFLLCALAVSIPAYFVFNAVGLGDGTQLRFWLIPVTLSFILGVHALRHQAVRPDMTRTRALVLAVFVFFACALQANPYSGAWCQPQYRIDPRHAEAIAAVQDSDASILMPIYHAGGYMVRYPQKHVVAQIPEYLELLNDAQLDRFLSFYNISCVYYPYEPSLASRLGWWGFVIHQRLGPYMLLLREGGGEIKQEASSFTHMTLHLGAALERNGEAEKARRLYETRLTDNPRDIEVRIALGNLLLQQGKVSEAVRHYQEALRQYPENPDALFNMGIAMHTLGKRAQAIQYYQKLLAINPADRAAQQRLETLEALEQ